MSSRKYSSRRIAYLIHIFFGLKLTILPTVVLGTGAIAVFVEELDLGGEFYQSSWSLMPNGKETRDAL